MTAKISHRKTNTFVFSNSGERYRPVYELDQETEKFIERGRVDLKEYVNSGFADVDLYTLINRYKTIDEVIASSESSVFYGDVSDMPKTMFDLPPAYVLEEQLQQVTSMSDTVPTKEVTGTNGVQNSVSRTDEEATA